MKVNGNVVTWRRYEIQIKLLPMKEESKKRRIKQSNKRDYGSHFHDQGKELRRNR